MSSSASPSASTSSPAPLTRRTTTPYAKKFQSPPHWVVNLTNRKLQITKVCERKGKPWLGGKQIGGGFTAVFYGLDDAGQVKFAI